MIDTPSNIRHDRIINRIILPYIAKVLNYNNPYGTNDPVEQARFRQIPTVNNMNYDEYVDCQDYALLFYALCIYYKIPVKIISNLTLLHAYNQIEQGFGSPVDIEPQGGEDQVFYNRNSDWMHGMTGREGEIRFRINTHPDNRIFNPYNWGDNEQSRGMWEPNIELLNYVIQNSKLPN
jgi:hypothetical protein